MTKSVANQKPIPSQTNRRHSDPPGLWIAVITGSVAIHLVAFWILRSYSYQLSLIRQQNSTNSAIPIEIIEVSPTGRSKVQTQAKAKPGSPQSSSNTQKSVAVTDEDAIALIDKKTAIASNPNSSLPPQQPSDKPTVNQQQTAKPQLTTQPKSTPSIPPTPKPESSAVPQPDITPATPSFQTQQPEITPATPQPDTIPPTPPPDQTDIPTSKSENPIPDEQNQALSPDINATTPPTDTSPSTNSPINSQFPKQPDTNISLGKSTSLPTLNPSIQPPPSLSPDETQSDGGLVATWNAFSRDEMIDLLQKGMVRQDVPPDILAQPVGENTKELPVSFISSEPDLDNVDLLVSLAIDQNGKLITRDANGNPAVDIIDMTPEELKVKKTKYQQLLIDLFQNVSFNPARNQDGSKPSQSNLVVRVKIERR
ncbi:MAG: hypothetical protein KME28_25265 [Pelatocladus maniniholoensis HA4357-MV3]|jgi:hypothetical protein|uniref:Uncharacterized protein n=1 Tax=Pelatocladus maniniholoensis HA4357-MV3 TaxID=1117104 RepID=A0A9E3HDY1_9NOST|nr:hypothetical protein [Pelatocladus maniniholoensis HA4357-MV3]BAZ68457.1 hypothetical protein NIES4106_32200 [Fischerella sp. NIES-4106]